MVLGFLFNRGNDEPKPEEKEPVLESIPEKAAVTASLVAEKAQKTAETTAAVIQEKAEEAKETMDDATADLKCKMWFQKSFGWCMKGQEAEKVGAIADV